MLAGVVARTSEQSVDPDLDCAARTVPTSAAPAHRAREICELSTYHSQAESIGGAPVDLHRSE